jgi:hypothetical protein
MSDAVLSGLTLTVRNAVTTYILGLSWRDAVDLLRTKALPWDQMVNAATLILDTPHIPLCEVVIDEHWDLVSSASGELLDGLRSQQEWIDEADALSLIHWKIRRVAKAVSETAGQSSNDEFGLR